MNSLLFQHMRLHCHICCVVTILDMSRKILSYNIPLLQGISARPLFTAIRSDYLSLLVGINPVQ